MKSELLREIIYFILDTTPGKIDDAKAGLKSDLLATRRLILKKDQNGISRDKITEKELAKIEKDKLQKLK